MNDPLLRTAEWFELNKERYAYAETFEFDYLGGIIEALRSDPDLRDYVYNE